MNRQSQPLYTNQASPEFLRSLDNSPFTEQQLAQFNEEVLASVRQQQAFCTAHPALGIYRLATTGSQTREGGVIQQGTTQMEITLENGQLVHVAQVGDIAVYADGSTAQIVTGAGQGKDHMALVGSRLSNGDEVINTLQGRGLFMVREGETLPEDFLPTVEG